jgi:hypothetical protein
MEEFYQKCMLSWFARLSMFSKRVGLVVKCMSKLRMWTRGKVMKKGNNKRRKKGDSECDETSRGYVVTGFVEGEENPEVMRQYQRELEADERALEEDSSDDDYDQSEDHVPKDW